VVVVGLKHFAHEDSRAHHMHELNDTQDCRHVHGASYV